MCTRVWSERGAATSHFSHTHSNMAEEDPSSPFGFLVHEEYRVKLIQSVVSMWVSTARLTNTQLKKLCVGSLQTPKQCRKVYLQQLRVLLKRIHRTTNEAEGGRFFRQDIDQLQLDVQQVLNAGVAQADRIQFCRHKPGQGQLLF